MTKVWAAFIQKERRLAPKEETKSLFRNSWSSTKGEGDRRSAETKRVRQNRLRISHPQKRVDP